MNSFELLFLNFENDVIIDKEYYTTKEEQCKSSEQLCNILQRFTAFRASSDTPTCTGMLTGGV